MRTTTHEQCGDCLETPSLAAEGKNVPQSLGASGDCIVRELETIPEDARYIASVELDRLKFKAHRAVLMATLSILFIAMLCVLISGSVVLVLFGTAQGLSDLFGGRVWLGCLTTGIAVLGATGISGLIVVRWHQRTRYERVSQRYADRKVITGDSSPQSEEAFLIEQSKAARSQLAGRWEKISEALESTSVARWMKTHPMLSASLASMTGYLVIRHFSAPRAKDEASGEKRSESNAPVDVNSLLTLASEVMRML